MFLNLSPVGQQILLDGFYMFSFLLVVLSLEHGLPLHLLTIINHGIPIPEWLKILGDNIIFQLIIKNGE